MKWLRDMIMRRRRERIRRAFDLGYMAGYYSGHRDSVKQIERMDFWADEETLKSVIADGGLFKFTPCGQSGLRSSDEFDALVIQVEQKIKAEGIVELPHEVQG